MKLLSKGLIYIFLLTYQPAISMAADLSGTVVKVSDLDVIVKVEGDLMPMTGDIMELSFTIPDGESIPIGTWKITQVTDNMAVASVKENTGDPVVGHKAVIFSENPVPRIKAEKVIPREDYNAYGETDEVQQLIGRMRSSNSGEKRNAVREAYKNYLHKPSVVAVAAEELEKGYNVNLNDRYHVDAMAWCCNVLGGSNDQRYMGLLKKIYKEHGSKKIREFAKKNYKILR